MSEIRISTSVYFQSEHITTGPRLSDSAVLYFCYRRQKFMTKNTCKFSQCISQSKHPQNMLKAHFNDSIWTCWKNVFNVSTLNSPLWYIEIQITNFIPFCLQKQIIIIWNALSDNPVHVTIEQRLGIATTERKSVLCTFYEMVLYSQRHK